MQSLSLKIILNDGAVTRVIKFPARATAADACRLVQEKVLTGEDGKDFGLFLPSADDDLSGIWLEDGQQLTHYLLRDGDSLHYRSKVRTLRMRTLDGAVKTMQVDESQPVQSLMITICARLGITNYEEYGLRREDEPEEVAKPTTGTLTLKRKPKTREKDPAMDQLSKKLKTDDNVKWLEQHKTLRENAVPLEETVLLQRRLFYSDRKVDARDPVQLGLLYAQERDALLAGRHHVTEARAVEFAGIQCQVQFGDHQEDKHKPGFIEDLKDFLPENYASSRGIEKKILREHKKHAGLSEIEAKFVYTKSVRDLPTYGVTFFLVKEILQGRKKLVPRLLGISAHSVLRMDETTKDILNEWPLTQIKTYKAGKGELFTLNFGEYRDKEYCVKTNDAYRIRDILQAYIDLIRKKMAAPFNATADDVGAIYSATVESSKGTVMEVVSHSPNKAVETSFVGPSRIISYEHGSSAQAQGAQIMTAQQVLVMSRQHNQQTAVAGEARELPAGAARRLNRLNGLAVSVVELLTEPNSGNVDEARKIIQTIEEDMPSLVEDIQECIEKQQDEAARQKLSSDLNELQDTVAELARFKRAGAARRAAHAGARLYLALERRARRAGDLLRRSRDSFIEDERSQATLQRASLVNTVALAGEAIDNANDTLDKNYEGTALTQKEAECAERSARDKLAKLNAAIALFTHAHSDPNNIDYPAAVNAMNTIKELLPELAKDVQALGTADGEMDRGGQARALRELCDAVRRVCACAGCDDPEKLHDAADDFAKKSKPLLFTFSRGEAPAGEREILSLAEEADEKARLLLSTAGLIADASDGDAAETLRAAVRRCENAARGLRACVWLTAPSIREPHCRSALAAAAGELAAAARAAAAAGRPPPALKQQTADLLEALASLNGASGDLDGDDNAGPDERERRRLRFTNTAAAALRAADRCRALLRDERAVTAPEGWIGDTLPLRLAQLAAAAATLAGATRDAENPDYDKAQAAMAAVQRHLPGFINDATWYSGSLPPASRAGPAAALGALAGAARALAVDAQDAEALAEFTSSAGQLAYVCDRRAAPEREREIIDLAKACCESASELLSRVSGALDGALDDALADRLDAAGARAAESAEMLLTTAALTAPTVHIPHSRRALHESALSLAHELRGLAHAWAAADPAYAQPLEAAKKSTDEQIQKLLDALNKISADNDEELKEDPVKQKKRVRFALSLSQTGDVVEKAVKEIDKPMTSQPLTAAQAQAARLSLADKLAALNAALASLAAATQDPVNPDFEAAEKATVSIQQLLPQVVEETKAVSGGEQEPLAALRELCAGAAALGRGAGDAPSPDAAGRYARAAARLADVCTPRDARAQEREKQVVEQSAAACAQAQALLARALPLPAPAPARAAARAAAALARAAQLTSSSLHAPCCRSELIRAASELSSAIAQLDAACRRPGQGSALAEHRQAFDDAVEELMKTIRSLDAAGAATETERGRLRFTNSLASTKVALDAAEKSLDEPPPPPAAPAPPAAARALAERLGALNGAAHALLAATRDPSNQDYAMAETASTTMRELVPDIVKDAKALGSGAPGAGGALRRRLRALCAGAGALCAGAASGSPHELNEAVAQFSRASGKLLYVFRPDLDRARPDQIIECCETAREKTSQLLQAVHLAAERGQDRAAGGRAAAAADAAGAADAADALLSTAQLTAHTSHSPPCQSALLEAADRLQSSVQGLQAAWAPLADGPGFQSCGVQLQEGQQAVEAAIQRVKGLVRDGGKDVKAKPAVPLRSGPCKAVASKVSAIADTSQFLDALRREASEVNSDQMKSPARVEEEERAESFGARVEAARGGISTAQDRLAKYIKSESKPRDPLDDAQISALNKQMEQKLARACAAAARLLTSRSAEKLDYVVASESVNAIANLLPTIATDATALSETKDARAREAFLNDMLGLCTTSVELCDAAKKDKKALTESALLFGERCSQLLRAVGADIDPAQQEQVLSRARAVGEAACRAAQRGAGPAAALATDLVYTAKLVAPSIQDPECQDALITASKNLSKQLKSVPANRPDLASELAALQLVLEGLQRDLADGKLVKRKEQLVIEDTPFRRLTEQIIEHAKQNAESTERSAEERRAQAAFANRLTDALRALDRAAARCRNAPRDMSLHANLEDAVYQVQALVLQERPGAARGAVVDLAEYLSAVCGDAERLQRAAGAGRAAGALRAQAQAVRAAAQRARAAGGDLGRAVQECVSGAQKISAAAEDFAPGAGGGAGGAGGGAGGAGGAGGGAGGVSAAARALRQSCALLRFAAQSADATAQCAGLDEAVSDLAELGARVGSMLQPAGAAGRRAAQPAPARLAAARARLAAAAARAPRRAPPLAPALARYAAALRAHADLADGQRRGRLADHLERLQEQLQLLAMEAARRLQTWQTPAHGEAMDQLLQELDRMEEVLGVKSEEGAARVAPEDGRRLLLPGRARALEGGSEQLEAKLESSATKLNSMTETITLSVGKPESLARTAHLTSESAVQLAAIARAMKTDEDPTRNSTIEEASEELCFVTYNLLKTAESVSPDPDSLESRRRLLDACRALTDAINKLVRTSSSGDGLRRECGSLGRALRRRIQPRPTCPLSYTDCVAAIHSQHDTIQSLTSDQPISREEFSTSLQVLATAVSASVEYSENCAYLLAISGQHPRLAERGAADARRARGLAAAARAACLRATRSGIAQQAKEESSLLSKQLADLRQAVEECAARAEAPADRLLLEASGEVDATAENLLGILNSEDVSAEKLTAPAFATVEALSALDDVTQHPALMPQPPAAANGHVDEVIDRSKELVSRALALLRAVQAAGSQQPMTWVLFTSYSGGVVEASDQLLTCLKTHGQNAGILEVTVAEADEETDATFMSYVQTQVAIANKWLSQPTFKPQIKTDGEAAAKNVIDIGKKMATYSQDADADEMRHLSDDCEQLLARCRDKYDQEAASLLMDRLKDLAKAVDRCIVSMVVEDLIEEEEPLQDLETLVDAEQDEAKRKHVLERKVRELLAHLARVTSTARALGAGRGGAPDLARCSDQASLLAPMLVKAAEKRVIFPTEKAVVEQYRTQLARYSRALSRVRELCDRAVDPMQFVQTAEEKMQRLKEESASHQDDLQKYNNTSAAIRKLANRAIDVSMWSAPAQRDPELMRALAGARGRLRDASPRASRLPDWHDSIAEILRATGEVESVLGGEMIFNKLPEPGQPIYNAARDLHAAVREWSARDNELVSEAKRMAVLMAKLSDYMHADKKREVISTSKAIVAASHEVARLARKLALECTDERIRTNLLHLCDQILMISAQLKMLSNVKKSSFGHQGSEEDIEAMNMLVGNAQNLMSTIQKTVSAANGASVKIRSQRGGPRIRWVRKNYLPAATSPALTF